LPCCLPDVISLRPECTDRPKRYELTYVWDEAMPLLGVISCNPSGATRHILDDTLYITAVQAMILGFGGIDQCNISPTYEPDSEIAHLCMDLEDNENWSAIERVLANETVWLSWGSGLVRGGSADNSARRWRQAEERTLELIDRRQRRGHISLLAKEVRQGNCYHPPYHPKQRRRKVVYYEQLYAVHIERHIRAPTLTRRLDTVA